MLYPQLTATRFRLELGGLWFFLTDPNEQGEQAGWPGGLPLEAGRELAVPASWNEQADDLYNYHGLGWYEKRFKLPADFTGLGSKRIFLRVGSVFYSARLWINGILCGEITSPYLPFDFEINHLLRAGQENRLIIRVDSRLKPDGLPSSIDHPDATDKENKSQFDQFPAAAFDFFPYGGIHRPVYLYTTSLTYIKDITLNTRLVGQENAILDYQIELEEPGDQWLNLKISTAGQQILRPVGKTSHFSGQFELRSARLWSPADPFLYKLEIQLYGPQQELLDEYSLDYGVREIRLEGQQLLLNGQPLFLKGLCKHEDFPIVGRGLSLPVLVRDFELLEWVGANSVRTSHYPYAEEFLDYADRRGLLVIDETPFVGLHEGVYQPDQLIQATDVISRFIKRDKNHPSVIMWSLANEPQPLSSKGDQFFEALYKHTKALDQSRPVTYVAHLTPAQNSALKHFDLVCLNQYHGWYSLPGQLEPALDQFEQTLEAFWQVFQKPILVSEFGAEAVAGLHSTGLQMFTEEYQAEFIEKYYNLIRSKLYCVGAHVWCFADFRTPQHYTRVVENRKGVFTRDRQPKLAAHRLRQLWNHL